MDSPTAIQPSTPSSAPGCNDDSQRVKFLCSFLGNIMPRPLDGKLRYVGGETRIVSVPRDIGYEELMSKMRELYDGAAILKYQQPDEDLDALVSVVNDDDVVNMMEEYDKLGSSDGFTRLRIFLFSQAEQDISSHFIDGDERDTERSVDAGLHSQRSGEVPMTHFNLHHPTLPHIASGQHQQPVSQRYSDVDAPWSPAYYSPRHHGHHDSRSVVEFPSSPSSARYQMPFSELPDKCLDRMPEEYTRHQVNHHSAYDNQPQYSDNVVWYPTGPTSSEKSGFPGNIIHGPHAIDGNGICDHCRMNFQRSQSPFEHPNISNGLLPVANPDVKLHPVMYPNEPNLPHQTNNRVEEARSHVSGSGRLNDHYVHDAPGISFSLGHGSVADGHHLPSNYVHQRVGPELGPELFHDQAMATTAHPQIPLLEERSGRYGNSPPYVVDSHYPVTHGHVPGLAFWRNTPAPLHIGPSYEASSSPRQLNGVVNAGIRGESSPRIYIGPDSQSPWVDSSHKMPGHDGLPIPEFPYTHAVKFNPRTLGQENQHPVAVDAIRSPQDMNVGIQLEPVRLPKSPFNMAHNNEVSNNDTHISEAMGSLSLHEDKGAENADKAQNSNAQSISFSEQNKITENNSEAAAFVESKNAKPKPIEECGDVATLVDGDLTAPEDSERLATQFSFLPEFIASVKKAVLEGAEEVKAIGKEHTTSQSHNSAIKDDTAIDGESGNAHGDLELDSDNDNVVTSKIEPTKAEAEAIAKGLQTIKNDDLEEIRELGSGTYGAVYHGKWKGSDVAIKRIKASCFAGRPSERERLIADFWKEALILSSLHHPNVVSFYGIVRDGPDSSLATVTEFMINGSLKQFLHKKDRTIDRRKRLIIAMDAAFGMEYLHGKNIVHFDLKCENLLVNMRDPQRPVCKIGDLGLSKVKQHTLVSGGVRGTLPWMAPELLSGKSNMVSEKIDVYSFGIVMWELLTGDEPYADMHCASIIGGIVNNTLRPQIPTWCDPEWKSLMESCWASDPAERPSFSEISKKLRSMAAQMNVK
ncbi:hypothetical protein K1719_004061 [Acacia pycnantha]|nr:hypothetical protein K1719_004061 [Acacia pycnantha]